MKKTYVTPMAEKLEFDYAENVNASNIGCIQINDNGNYIGCAKNPRFNDIG